MVNAVALAHASHGIATFVEKPGGWADGDVFEGLWPTWQPGGGTLARSTVGDDAALRVENGEESAVPGSVTRPPMLLGPRLPHYAHWSPDGRHLCYVVPDGQSLVLKVWNAGAHEARSLLSGAPIFPAWSPDSSTLAVHHGGNLSLFDVASGRQTVLSEIATGFRTPAWCHDGRELAWAEFQGGAVEIRIGTPAGDARTVASFPSGVALAYRPRTTELAVASTTSAESGVFGRIVVLREGAQGPRTLLNGPLTAFWWAPSGERIAALVPVALGDGRFQLRFSDGGGHPLGAAEAMFPAQDTATMVGFFDQYGLSHSPWSADSRWFGFCGRFLTEGPHASFGQSAGDVAWLWEPGTAGLPLRIGLAGMLSFSREVNGG